MAETEVAAAVDSILFRKTLGHWASGVTVVTTAIDEVPHGMTASAFCSLSLEPPMVLVSVAHKARMHATLAKTMRYGVSILAQDQEHLSQHFAGRPQEGLVVPFVWRQGVPLLEGAVAHVVCKVVEAHAAGDHTLYIGLVEHLRYSEGMNPLVYYSGKYRGLAELAVK